MIATAREARLAMTLFFTGVLRKKPARKAVGNQDIKGA
jgi:hypothetical protein